MMRSRGHVSLFCFLEKKVIDAHGDLRTPAPSDHHTENDGDVKPLDPEFSGFVFQDPS